MKGASLRCGLLGALVALLLLAASAFLVAITGIVDVSAANPHAAVSRWYLSLAMQRSVRFHAEEDAGAVRADSALLRQGARHFRTMCVECHGAPGVDPGDIGQGLNPEAAELSATVGRWSDAELRWIIRNGIRMTGMPAFDRTHGDEEIGSLVAFLRSLQGLPPEEYVALMRTLHPPASSPPDSGKSREKAPAWKRRSLF